MKRFIPPVLRPTARAMYHKCFRISLRIRFWCADHLSQPGYDMPLPPALLRYRVSELLAVNRFFEIGESCASLIQERTSEMGLDFANGRRVLDFGCGCGR